MIADMHDTCGALLAADGEPADLTYSLQTRVESHRPFNYLHRYLSCLLWYCVRVDGFQILAVSFLREIARVSTPSVRRVLALSLVSERPASGSS